MDEAIISKDDLAWIAKHYGSTVAKTKANRRRVEKAARTINCPVRDSQINFRVTAQIRHDIFATARAVNKSMADLLEDMFRHYLERKTNADTRT